MIINPNPHPGASVDRRARAMLVDLFLVAFEELPTIHGDEGMMMEFGVQSILDGYAVFWTRHPNGNKVLVRCAKKQPTP